MSRFGNELSFHHLRRRNPSELVCSSNIPVGPLLEISNQQTSKRDPDTDFSLLGDDDQSEDEVDGSHPAAGHGQTSAA